PRDVGPLLQGFQGLAHRCQPFCEVNGCTFIDDSKGTNVAATKTAIRSFEEGLIVLLGGKGKGEDYTELAETVAERVRFAVLLGEERYRIARSLDALGYRSYVSVASMEEAVEAALCRSGPGDVVLLSPACTSWDMYHNFGERGDHFQALVCERVRSGRTSGGFA
ncbi:MAG: UDP-N-acetylmuramoyl-L-alanine--D-glutamate ligase, partial [Synergistales bacterium]|nr:UDP-N-acetylmuramoyl-L-alanine--D-glutamate ligase [Synergistales bacterium]